MLILRLPAMAILDLAFAQPSIPDHYSVGDADQFDISQHAA
jgi:hypothetical protein